MLIYYNLNKMEKKGIDMFIGKFHGIGKIVEKEMIYFEDLVIEEFKSDPTIILNLASKTYKEDHHKYPLQLETGIIRIFPAKEGHKERQVEAHFSHAFGMNEYGFGTFLDNELHIESNKPEHFLRGDTTEG